MPTNHSPASSVKVGGAGSRLVLAMIVMAGALAAFAVWFQWRQTHRCLAFYGPAVAAAIQTADRVEFWTLERDADRIRVARRRDVSGAAGLVHLRHGLVEDANFTWGRDATARLPAEDWDHALAFFIGEGTGPAAILALDCDDGGWLTVVGKPGRVGLGRIATGLRTWFGSVAEGRQDEPGVRF